MSHRTSAIALACACALGSGACNSASPTQLVVLVNSDYRAPSELAEIGVTIAFTNEGEIASARLKVADPDASRPVGTFVLPLSFGIGPKEGNLSDRVTIELSAFAPSSGEQALFTRHALTGFIEKKTLLLPMFLARSCARASCPSDQTCTETGCAPAEIDPGTLRAINPGNETVGIDAGPKDTDAGSVDAGGRTPVPAAVGRCW